MKVEVSAAELLDKITVLELKNQRITDAAKLENVRYELDLLSRVRAAEVPNSARLDGLIDGLRAVNSRLWGIEDELRQCERDQDFSERFISLARAVYRENDERARLKKQVNLLLGSSVIEEKSYQSY